MNGFIRAGLDVSYVEFSGELRQCRPFTEPAERQAYLTDTIEKRGLLKKIGIPGINRFAGSININKGFLSSLTFFGQR